VKRIAQAAGTEAALKDAARRLFARQGYLNTKIIDITTEAGRAAGSFYNHFASKEELLKGASGRHDRRRRSGGGRAAGRTPRRLHRTRCCAWHVAAYWRFHTRYRVELTALRQAALVNPEFGAQVEAIVAEDVGHLRGHLDWITKAGRTLPGEPEVVLAMFTGLLDGLDTPGRCLAANSEAETLTMTRPLMR